MAKNKKPKLVADQSIRTTYRTVQDDDITLFNDGVNRMLDEGWELYGNPMVVYDRTGAGVVHSQALILKEVNNG